MTTNRFEEREAPGSRSFFTEIIASISDIRFAKDGRHILSRDYMTLKVPPFYSSNCFFPFFVFSVLRSSSEISKFIVYKYSCRYGMWNFVANVSGSPLSLVLIPSAGSCHRHFLKKEMPLPSCSCTCLTYLEEQLLTPHASQLNQVVGCNKGEFSLVWLKVNPDSQSIMDFSGHSMGMGYAT